MTHLPPSDYKPPPPRVVRPESPYNCADMLKVYKQHGRSQSSFLSQMNHLSGQQTFGAELRYTDAIIFWLQCDQQVLG